MPLKLVRRKGFEHWYIRGTLDDIPVYKTTKTADKAIARRKLADLERDFRAGHVERDADSFRGAADQYIDWRNPTKHDRQAIDRLCGEIGHLKLREIRIAHFVDAARALYPGCSEATWNRNVIAPGAAIMHYAADNNLCSYVRLRRFREKQPEHRALAESEADRLIAAATGPLKLLLIFLFCQGWRVSDALRLRLEDVDIASGTARHYISKIDRYRRVPLHTRVLALLQADPKDAGPLFPWPDRYALYRDLRPFCKALGVAFTPHMARHSFATWRAAEGATTNDLMAAGGWLDHKSVLRYIDPDEDRTRAVINRRKG